mmetsp:Transcript_77477/g.140891  ORF Transcript_77477/g.140891 Transcript_77477/m.140891 type:complete len:131 (-) Transcript_77477:1-393(-)
MRRLLSIDMMLLHCMVAPSLAFSPLRRPASPAVAQHAKRQRPIVATAGASGKSDSKAARYSMEVPYREADYDPVAADAFFRKRPLKSFGRFARLASLSGGFVLGTLVDKLLKREDKMVEKRSQQLLELVT